MSFSVQDTVTAALQLVQHTADQAGARISVVMPDQPLRVSGRPERFEQVIVNLLRNAVDATSEADHAEVELTVSQSDTSVIITVTDNGHGLGELQISDLREPFFSTKPSGKGMGLGLAISAQIIDEMGGTIHAENARTEGATFVITLPSQKEADV